MSKVDSGSREKKVDEVSEASSHLPGRLHVKPDPA